MRKLMLAVVAAVAVSTAGCASLMRQAFQEPKVSLKDVRLNGLGLTGGQFDVVLNVYNPNGYRLDATSVTYKLQIGQGVDVASGTLSDRYTVQENDSLEVRIPVAFTFRGLGEAGRQLINQGAIDYRVAGNVTVATPAGNFTLPYSTSGRYSTLGGSR